jgi:hypothetical protein
LGVFDRVSEYSDWAPQGCETQILVQTITAFHEHVHVLVDVDVVGFFLAAGRRSKLRHLSLALSQTVSRSQCHFYWINPDMSDNVCPGRDSGH